MANDALSYKDREPRAFIVEQAAYVAIGLLTAGLRFFQLGLRPLSEGEATQALAAFQFTRGIGQAAPAGTIPALFTGNVVGFTLMGASDITTRLLPVLAGLILVLLPYWLRHRLGRIGALAAALLLALSPSAVYFSRALDSAIVVAACGLALVVGLICYADTRRPIALYLVAVALGLALCAGPGTFTLLLIFSTFPLLLYASDRLLDRDTGWSSLLVAWWAARGEKGLLAKVGAVFAATFGLVATAFVLHPAGVGHAADLIATWAKSFLPEVDGNPAIYPLFLLLRYEPLILLLGMVEVGYALAGRPADRQAAQPGSSFPHTIFLVYWAGAATLAILLSGHRPAGNILLVVVPLALLAGQRLEMIWRQLTRRYRIPGQGDAGRALWPESVTVAAVAIGLLVFFYLQLAAYGLTHGTTTVSFAGITLYSTTAYLLLAAVALLLLIGLGVAAGFWRGTPLVAGSAWLVATVMLGLFGFKAMWGLSFAHATDSRELMIGRTTAPEVRLMAESLEALSQAEMGDAHTRPVTVDAATGPVVAWYLREFERQTTVEDLSAPPDTVAAVTLAMQDPPIGETFRGQGFPLRTRWLPWGLWEQTLIRWLLFTEASLPIVDQEVVLWMASQ
jgi:uncharacterized protein (TIGR03663 family)